MAATPPLPGWVLGTKVPGYTTAHARLPEETRLYGTESLYGDWSGRVLLLAKDFAPSRILDERLARGDPRPYRHEPDLLTNRRLGRFLGVPSPADPTACGLLYGSALANLLRDDGRFSGEVPNRRAAMSHGARVLRFALDHMPRLANVVCMGREAWEATTAALGDGTPWREAREHDGPQRIGRFTVVLVPHPAARIATHEHERAWSLARAVLLQ